MKGRFIVVSGILYAKNGFATFNESIFQVVAKLFNGLPGSSKYYEAEKYD